MTTQEMLDMEETFKKDKPYQFKLGDRVKEIAKHFKASSGTVIDTNSTKESDYPLEIRFDNGNLETYTSDGRIFKEYPIALELVNNIKDNIKKPKKYVDNSLTATKVGETYKFQIGDTVQDNKYGLVGKVVETNIPYTAYPLFVKTTEKDFLYYTADGRELKGSEVQLRLIEKASNDKPTYSASDLLKTASDLLDERGKQYDSPTGERSMKSTTDAFYSITGIRLTEAEGFLFMQILKDVRQWQTDTYHQDSAEDCISYAALKAEALQYN